ncbi:M23 family metallopeptidase [Nocardia cyriacigeorgica]|uniref:M23 family metallopeptidase n=1 Tax=Nocardia cyriacigeorgica TaxID=135487 RepID=UPI00245461FF|nr:M23 family metallopeptidase [Nocardia cyriacigeorgica]
MPQHRVGPSSVTVSSLIGDGAAGRPTRHRAEAGRVERVKAAATAAVAAGALIGTAAQIAPAIAYASPLLPGSRNDNDADHDVAPVSFAEPAAEVPAAEAPAAPAPIAEAVTPVAAPVAAPAPVAVPFGIGGLPPEIAGPLAQAEQVLKDLQQKVAPAPAVRPVAGAISSSYGSRWGAMHYGIDFADALGAPIHSVSSGTVVEAGPASGFGLWVRILQDDGTTAVYGHVNDMFVQAGQRVNAGDVIATVGNRGQSTGPHLHLEIWDQGGAKIDPIPYLASKGVPMEWGPSSH